jgi:cation diffusion facilitator family transporter
MLTSMPPGSVRRYLFLSLAAAVATMGMKTVAWLLTGSVGLLSDALESGVNLVAAVVALAMIAIAEKPADEEHAFGHDKAEYFSSAVEGGLIVLAAASIAWTAIPRLLNPQPLANLGVGFAVSAAASAVNLAVARVLLAAGRRHGSIALEADGKHLLTDVWTTAGVLAGVALVKLTGWLPLDPLLALAVAANIVFSGVVLMRRSALGLLDSAIAPEKRAALASVLAEHGARGVDFHAVLTRQAGRRSFVAMHVLVPADWTVRQGHEYLEEVEREIRDTLGGAVTVFTHLEPLGDPSAMDDHPLAGSAPRRRGET